jgi:hypothetical protein
MDSVTQQNNVIDGKFGNVIASGNCQASADSIDQQAVQEQITSYVSLQSKERLLKLPNNLHNVGPATKSFARELGLMPQIDSKTISNSMVSAAQLRATIKQLRSELIDDVSELRKKGDRYIHFAENIGTMVGKAESFGAKHPSLTWLFKLAMQDGKSSHKNK